MNTKDMLKKLAALLTSFSLHPQFTKELATLLKKDLKGKESVFFKMLSTQLGNIKNFGKNVLIKSIVMKFYKVLTVITILFTCKIRNLTFVWLCTLTIIIYLTFYVHSMNVQAKIVLITTNYNQNYAATYELLFRRW